MDASLFIFPSPTRERKERLDANPCATMREALSSFTCLSRFGLLPWHTARRTNSEGKVYAKVEAVPAKRESFLRFSSGQWWLIPFYRAQSTPVSSLSACGCDSVKTLERSVRSGVERA